MSSLQVRLSIHHYFDSRPSVVRDAYMRVPAVCGNLTRFFMKIQPYSGIQ